MTVVAATSTWMQPEPPSGTVVVAAGRDDVNVDVAVRARRWGRHEVGLERVVCTSRLGAFRSEVPGSDDRA